MPRRLLAKLLRRLREDAGVSAEEAFRAISVSKHTLWRMETGQPTKLAPHTIRVLCELYRASEEDTRVARVLCEEARNKGWWLAFGDAMPEGFGMYVGLEEAADRLSTYQNSMLTGLIQTAEYRRELIWTESPHLAPSEVERRVELSVKRQARLTSGKSAVTLSVLLDEAVLHRPVGGPRVMGDQLRHLVDVAALPNVTIRVIPWSAGTYLGPVAGSFVLLEFPLHPVARLTVPPVVYVEGFAGDLYLEKDSDIERYRGAYTAIERMALDESESRILLQRRAKELSR
ncbi:helix-turn-helix domain-containing protein [Nocardia sp. IFM 10818]